MYIVYCILYIVYHSVTNKKVIIYPLYLIINKWNNDNKLFTNMILQN